MSFVKLNEASLSRVYSLKDKNGFAVVAVKEYGDTDETENKKLHEAKKHIREAGYGYIILSGKYFERKDENSAWQEYPSEKSILIPAKIKNDTFLKEFVIKLATGYNQSTIFWADGSGGIKYVDVKTGNEISSSLEKFTPDIAKTPTSKTAGNQYGYSMFTKGGHKNRVFVFENILYPYGYMNNVGLAAQGYECYLAHHIVEGKKDDSNDYKLFESNNFNDAYWISPTGKIMNVDDKHITAIIHSPESFGLTREEIVSTYKKYNEKMGQEGKAREEIIKSIISKGYIRVRLYPKQGFWSINLNNLNNKNKNLLQQWAEKVIVGGGSRNNNVIISTLDSGTVSSSVEDISKDKLYESFNYKSSDESILLCYVESFKKTDIEVFFNLSK